MPAAMTMMKGITVGADPELFIYDTDKGQFVCPDGLIPGTKEEPFKVDGGAVQQDGFAAEFNIDPSDNYKDFSDRIRGVRAQLKKMLPSHMDLIACPTAQFTQEVWDSALDQTKILGCSPDYNAWALNVNPPAKAEDRVRCAGGHLHLGWTEDADQTDPDYFKASIDLVRQLDWYLGAWSVLQDDDVVRRSMYGKAGSMRFKPYGVEYRTLSNFWLSKSSYLLQVWNRMCQAIEKMGEMHYPTQYATFNKSLITAINKSSKTELVMTHNAFSTPVKHYT